MFSSQMFSSLTFTLPITFFDKMLKSMVATLLIGSCLLMVTGCDAQNISNDSTVGSNNIAQTEPDIINRNSMQDVPASRLEDSQHDSHNSKESHKTNKDNVNVKQ